MPNILLKACLNGARSPDAHPALPVTPAALAEASRAAVATGAGALHIHPRNNAGLQSLLANDIAAAVQAIRLQCPGVPVGVSTLFSIVPDPEERVRQVLGWTTLPDFASVNFNEPGTLELCAALERIGVGIEAGLGNAGDAQLLVDSRLDQRCLRLLIEPEEEMVSDALATVAAIEALLDQAGIATPRLLHGMEATTWPLIDAAIQREYATRIGLEDVLTLPNGQLARDNAELVAHAIAQLGI